MSPHIDESIGEHIIQDEGMENMEARQEYYGPVFLTEYVVSNGDSYFWVDDPSKLPENAIAVRVPDHKPVLANMLTTAGLNGKPVSISHTHRWNMGEGKIAWTIWRAKIEF
jgi:hypothetical protein